jgi:hypothetical protein
MIKLNELTQEQVLQDKELCDRVGLAWVRLNKWKWDEICGNRPSEFDNMTKEQLLKENIINNQFDIIKKLFGHKCDMLKSWYWWKYELNRTFDEWIEWYMWGDNKNF